MPLPQCSRTRCLTLRVCECVCARAELRVLFSIPSHALGLACVRGFMFSPLSILFSGCVCVHAELRVLFSIPSLALGLACVRGFFVVLSSTHPLFWMRVRAEFGVAPSCSSFLVFVVLRRLRVWTYWRSVTPFEYSSICGVETTRYYVWA